MGIRRKAATLLPTKPFSEGIVKFCTLHIYERQEDPGRNRVLVLRISNISQCQPHYYGPWGQYKTPDMWGSIRAQRGRARSALFHRVNNTISRIRVSVTS